MLIVWASRERQVWSCGSHELDIKAVINISKIAFLTTFLLSDVTFSKLQLSRFAAHNSQPPIIQRATPPHLLCSLGVLYPELIDSLRWNPPLTRESLYSLIMTHQRKIIVERKMATRRPYSLNKNVLKAGFPERFVEVCRPAVGFSFGLGSRGMKDLRSSRRGEKG